MENKIMNTDANIILDSLEDKVLYSNEHYDKISAKCGVKPHRLRLYELEKTLDFMFEYMVKEIQFNSWKIIASYGFDEEEVESIRIVSVLDDGIDIKLGHYDEMIDELEKLGHFKQLIKHRDFAKGLKFEVHDDEDIRIYGYED